MTPDQTERIGNFELFGVGWMWETDLVWLIALVRELDAENVILRARQVKRAVSPPEGGSVEPVEDY